MAMISGRTPATSGSLGRRIKLEFLLIDGYIGLRIVVRDLLGPKRVEPTPFFQPSEEKRLSVDPQTEGRLLTMLGRSAGNPHVPFAPLLFFLWTQRSRFELAFEPKTGSSVEGFVLERSDLHQIG
jgi:hypothetical protein